jgi:hypothetical protein
MNRIERPHHIPPELAAPVMSYFRERLEPAFGHDGRSMCADRRNKRGGS